MIWRCKDIRLLSEEEYLSAYERTDPHKKARLEKTRQRKDRYRTVAADILAREMLSEVLACDPYEVAFGYEEGGRPYVIDSHYHFNISHSENLVAVALHTSPVGIDIERIREAPISMARRYFCADENLYLFGHEPQDTDFTSVPAPDVLLRFFEIWTAKEAYLKSQGKGLTHLRSINTTELCFQRHLLDDNYLLTVYTEED